MLCIAFKFSPCARHKPARLVEMTYRVRMYNILSFVGDNTNKGEAGEIDFYHTELISASNVF